MINRKVLTKIKMEKNKHEKIAKLTNIQPITNIQYQLFYPWRKMVENIALILRKYFQNKTIKVLDIGCAEGQLYPKLKQYGIKISLYCGLDISKNFASIAKKLNKDDFTFEAINANGLSLPFHEKGFQVALILNVIEHVPDPQQLIKEALCIADYVVINVPLEDEWPPLLSYILKKLEPHRRDSEFLFSHSTLLKIINESKASLLLYNTYEGFPLGALYRYVTHRSIPFLEKFDNVISKYFSHFAILVLKDVKEDK
jgi:SAM-dependent methyltransferase